MADSKVTYKDYTLEVTVKPFLLKESYILDEKSTLPKESSPVYRGICPEISFELETPSLKTLEGRFRGAVHEQLKQVSQEKIEQIKATVEKYESIVKQQQRFYRSYLEEKGFSFSQRYVSYEDVTDYYAVYSPYLQEFERKGLSKIPDWAMIPISKEIFELE